MRSVKSVVGWVVGLMCGLCGLASAQTLEEQAARFALMTTPAGALVPASTSSIESEVQRHVLAALRYGYLDGQQVQKQAFAVTAQIPIAFAATLSTTAGWAQCIDCGSGAMLSVGADWRFLQMPVRLLGEGRRVTVGINGEFGWGQTRGPLAPGGSAWTGTIGLPFGLINKGRPFDTWRFVPYVVPTFNYGALQDGDRPLEDRDRTLNGRKRSLDGAAWMLGGGLAIYKRTSPVSAHVGAQYIAIRDGDIVFGVGLVLGLR